ncbi:MAG TPA: T9SS type A sorting domain-containing protein [Bacteroidia bacterium]|nr:T9SS type A sorting domain-containing protein [Bacteroidia bacterium]
MTYQKILLRLVMLVAFTSLLQVNSVKAQDTLSFTPNGLSGWPDTAFAGDSIPVGAFLKNYSASSVFMDSLMVEGYVDTGLVVPFSIPYFQLYQVWQLAPGDSSFLIIPISFRPGNQGGPFRIGNNIVVVWPVSFSNSQWVTGDSITVNVFLIDTLSSTGGDYPPAELRIYPVPSRGPLYITSYHPQFQITEIIIRDAMGREVYRGESSTSPIDTESWAPGIYTVETTLSNGTSSFYKIIRQ